MTFNSQSLAKCRTLKLRFTLNAESEGRGWRGYVTVFANSRKPVSINCQTVDSSRDGALLDAGALERSLRHDIFAARNV